MLGFEEIVKYNLLYVDKYIFGKSWFYSENKVPYSMLRYIKNQEHRIASSAQQSCASPTKEKRLGRFSPLDFIEQLRAVRRIYVRLQ